MGRAIRALRRSTRAAEAFGVNTAAAKLLVFVYAAMLAGLAGWLYAHFQRSVSPGPFGITAGTEYLLMAVLGGAGRVYGAILGAAGITFLRDQLQNFLPWLIGNTGNYETIAFGAVLVLILQTASSGVWPILFGPPPAPAPPEPRDGTPARTTESSSGFASIISCAMRRSARSIASASRIGAELAVERVGFDFIVSFSISQDRFKGTGGVYAAFSVLASFIRFSRQFERC